jgi:hypothetical protein
MRDWLKKFKRRRKGNKKQFTRDLLRKAIERKCRMFDGRNREGGRGRTQEGCWRRPNQSPPPSVRRRHDLKSGPLCEYAGGPKGGACVSIVSFLYSRDDIDDASFIFNNDRTGETKSLAPWMIFPSLSLVTCKVSIISFLLHNWQLDVVVLVSTPCALCCKTNDARPRT